MIIINKTKITTEQGKSITLLREAAKKFFFRAR